ncbi:TPA: phage tail tape measure protein [Streptococcus agalactiae]|mgnify:FL=1|jgi:phage-related minor tail protein|uniref:TMP repeat protein n=2 Tax=Streptococcus TaxID=1301 RepID=W1TRZ2_STRAP|nr:MULTISPECIES: TMP repeat protein [Streptococcus]ETI84175.1 MAG: TMP repeat protein [Streptococcus anginosus DORA_7]QBX22328.1 tail length tape-measure protein [Streptococcus phage Javan69]HEQ4835926.1 phage tail tape measure protein [Streptococcus pyogenes]KXA49391.1 TMP repeat protein [Streptococcus agalactiae]MCW0946115.1 phage tail tape measure protein [Streptococcus anginosus]
MAGNIKGITIEIGGDTQPLQDALKGVNKQASEATKELRQIDKALKFDTGNVTLLTQKQEILAKQVETTKEKLATLRQAQSQVEAQFKAGDIGADQYRAFQREVETTQRLLTSYETKLADVSSTLENHGRASSSAAQQLDKLQVEQGQLASEMNKVTSQFELQESALSSNSSEAERNAIAQQKIGAQSEIVSKQISNLEKQLALTKSEYGENSIEANKMEAELNQAKTALNNLNNEMDETKSSADGAQDGMKAMSDTIRAEALQATSEKLANISQKIFEVGTESMSAAAQLQASNAQFSTVFGDMENAAKDALNKIGEEMDIVPERLQGSFTQMASFAKTSGMDTAQALDLTTRATRAAADGAAFYDKSIEEVTENLQSFLKGNYENDAALGISATETTRNAAANKLYGKSFNELSEAQKQLTLLQMVEDGNELSGALGQAARESDGLENVLGNLRQSGTNALAAIGQPILEMLIPVFQSLADIVSQLATWFTNLSSPIKEVVIIFTGILAVVGMLLPVFLGLQVAAAAMGTTVVGMITAFLPIVGIIVGIVAAITLLIVGLKELWTNHEGFRTAVTEIWNSIFAFLSMISQQISSFVMSIWGTLTTWWTENQQLILNAATTVWNAITTVIQTVMTILGPLIQASWENIKLIITAAWEMIKIVVETAINVVLGIIKAVMQVITGDWTGAWETIKQVLSMAWEGIKSLISLALNFIAQYISTAWTGIKNTISNLLTAISSVVSSIWSAIQSTISSILSNIGSTVSNIWNGIRNTVSSVLNGISSTVSSVWNGVKNTISNAINGARDAVSNAINAIKNLFNFQIRWPHIPLPHFRVSGSANPLDWLKGGIPRISIDWYAKGGILTKPTAFGVNGNSLMVGGEAGKEAVLPLNDQTLGAIGRGIAKTMTSNLPPIHITITGNTVREETDLHRLAEMVGEKLVYELERQQGLRGVKP